MDEAAVRERLATVEDPALGDDLVALNLVNVIDVSDDTISISLVLGAPYSPQESAIAADVREAFADVDYELELSARVDDRYAGEETPLPNVKNMIAVASGKGGVGKSTIAVNVAAGLAKLGARVALFDADVYGPNVPRMVGAEEPPTATADETMVPPVVHGVKLMSMGFLVGEDDPVIWRGPMVHSLLTQLWEDVEWGELDYMIVDLPPGTGDTQLTMLQTVPVTGAVIVTTPQDVALDDATKGLEMFGRHDVPVLGIAENMAGFRCPDCGSSHDIFGAGGGEAFAEKHDVPLLGSIPLDPDVRSGGDAGEPMVLREDEPTADAFRVLTENVANNTGIVHRRRQSMNADDTADGPPERAHQ